MVTLVNAPEELAINRSSVDRLVENVTRPPKQHHVGCKMRMWNSGRCIWSSPRMPAFDWFVRITVAFFSGGSML